ncbi:serine aminopeptidase domain-containing protein [Caviibacter abscessus]|uniref:serine aminopeptidase domain-containing protein n=1 Tax=Caviibacter abscessus TaxID=1766719 RepID=UPI00082ADE5C|nr:alpha/beta hydrolase [Caviibacter abscessus]
MNKFYYTGYKNSEIPYYEFSHKDDKNRKHILIIHDIFEPCTRYIEFAQFLYQNGYNVYVLELKAHGELRKSNIADFGEHGIEGVLQDINMFIHTKFLNLNYRDVVLFGHGYGSLIASYLAINNSFKNLILSSMPLEKMLVITSGIIKNQVENKLGLEVASFNKNIEIFNSKFKNESKYAFVTRDLAEQKRLLKEIDGYQGSPKFFLDILRLMRYVKRNIKNVREDISILAIYGSDDTSISQEKFKKYMVRINNKARKINFIKNQNGRRDSLHEINKAKIFDEILSWLNVQD